MALYPELAAYVALVGRELDAMSDDRTAALEQLSRFVAERAAAGLPAQLTFICTHNSRRSHLAQVWAQTAARLYGVPGVETFSGGTEATAFERRAAAALERAGFRVEERTAGRNPVYAVRYALEEPAMECFSKAYDQPPNPTSGFCAVMTCAAADQGCPVVFGASARITLPYDDPKAFDGTDHETEQYDERCRQIAREMLLAFSRAGTS